MIKYSFGLLFILLAPWQTALKAQNQFHGMEALFTTPRHYTADFINEPPVIDGDITGSVWNNVQWSEHFVSIKGYEYPRPPLKTKMKIAWNGHFLFVAAELEEPHVWATLKKRDAIIYYDNDFEVFIDPNNDTHQYFEIEVNAFNTIFDLFMPKPYRNGSRALISWNIDGLQSAVQIQGTLNNPDDTDRSWTVEMAIPFKAISMGTGSHTPSDGMLWRINFSRVQWETYIDDGEYVKKKGRDGTPLPEHNWVWSPQGVVNMHFPERWGYLIFNRNQTNPEHFNLPLSEKLKRYLWLVYYKQKEFFNQHDKYAESLEKLNLTELQSIKIGDKKYALHVWSAGYQFTATIKTSGKNGYMINQEGIIEKIKPPL